MPLPIIAVIIIIIILCIISSGVAFILMSDQGQPAPPTPPVTTPYSQPTTGDRMPTPVYGTPLDTSQPSNNAAGSAEPNVGPETRTGESQPAPTPTPASIPSAPIPEPIPEPIPSDTTTSGGGDPFTDGLPKPIALCPFGRHDSWDGETAKPYGDGGYHCVINDYTNFITADGKKGFTTSDSPTILANNMCWSSNGVLQTDENGKYQCIFQKGNTFTGGTNKFLNVFKEDIQQSPLTTKPNTIPGYKKWSICYKENPWRAALLPSCDSYLIGGQAADIWDAKPPGIDVDTYCVGYHSSNDTYTTEQKENCGGNGFTHKYNFYLPKNRQKTKCIGKATTPYMRNKVNLNSAECGGSGWTQSFSF